MEDVIKSLALELGKSINELDKTFEGKLNWFYHRKVEVLGKMLDELVKLQKEEQDRQNGLI